MQEDDLIDRPLSQHIHDSENVPASCSQPVNERAGDVLVSEKGEAPGH
jgi:hypothetical protein